MTPHQARFWMFGALDQRASAPLTDIHRMFTDIPDFQFRCIEEKIRGLPEVSSLLSVKRTSVSLKTGARVPHAEDSKRMNAKPEVRDALLVQRMWHWRLRAKTSSATSRQKWNARKNYLYLVRKYRALAAANHHRE